MKKTIIVTFFGFFLFGCVTASSGLKAKGYTDSEEIIVSTVDLEREYKVLGPVSIKIVNPFFSKSMGDLSNLLRKKVKKHYEDADAIINVRYSTMCFAEGIFDKEMGKIAEGTAVKFLSDAELPNNSKKPTEKSNRIASLPLEYDILFTSDRDTKSRRKEIYALDIESGKTKRLTFTNEHHFIAGIDYSRRFIVTSRAEKDTDRPKGLGDEDKRSLWILDLKTKQETRLTDPDNHAEGDSFSPDGKWVVFHMKLGKEEQSDIYKIRLNGSDLTRLTNTKDAIESDPAWSNNGKEIAFDYLDAKTPRFVLKKMNTDGKNVQTIYDGGKGVSTPVFPPGNYDPTWSPDDQWLVFERATKANGGNWGSGIWHIFKVKRDGSELVDLSEVGGHTDRAEYLPSFSPNGKFIVFGSMYSAKKPRQSHNDVFMMDINGNSLKRLTYSQASDMFPVWIPSGAGKTKSEKKTTVME